MKHEVLFRCDASNRLGLGHVKRCLNLAKQLSNSKQVNASFCTNQNSLGATMIKNEGYDVYHLAHTTTQKSYLDSLQRIIEINKTRAIIFDVRDDLEKQTITTLKHRYNLKIFNIDDGSERRLAADVNFFPPAPGVKKLKWDDYHGEVCAGWEWVVLGISDNEMSNNQRRVDNSKNNSILVSMGGGDKYKLTSLALKALSNSQNIDTVFVIAGPAMDLNYYEELKKEITIYDYPIELIKSPDSIADIAKECGIGIITFGVTAYELASLTIPTLNVAITEDHYNHSLIFEKSNISKSLGLISELKLDDFIDRINAFIIDEPLRKSMQEATLSLQKISLNKNVSKKIIDTINSD